MKKSFEELMNSEMKFNSGGLVYGPTKGLMGEYAYDLNDPKVIAPLEKLKKMLKTICMETRVKEIVKILLDEDFRQSVLTSYLNEFGLVLHPLEVNIIAPVFDLLELPTEEEKPGWRIHLIDHKWELLSEINFSDVDQIKERCSDKLCNLSDRYLEWLIERKKSLKNE